VLQCVYGEKDTEHVQSGVAGVECCSPQVADCKGRPNEGFKLKILISCARQLKMLTQMFENAPSDCDFPELVLAIMTALFATTNACIFTLCEKNATLLVCLHVVLCTVCMVVGTYL
jgi:hypothetical protein